MKWRTRSPSEIRDNLSYGLGFLGCVYETVIADGPAGERLPFLVIFAGLITAPAVLHKDAKREAKPAPVDEEAR